MFLFLTIRFSQSFHCNTFPRSTVCKGICQLFTVYNSFVKSFTLELEFLKVVVSGINFTDICCIFIDLKLRIRKVMMDRKMLKLLQIVSLYSISEEL